jgi:hypothetical protein
LEVVEKKGRAKDKAESSLESEEQKSRWGNWNGLKGPKRKGTEAVGEGAVEPFDAQGRNSRLMLAHVPYCVKSL